MVKKRRTVDEGVVSGQDAAGRCDASELARQTAMLNSNLAARLPEGDNRRGISSPRESAEAAQRKSAGEPGKNDK
jgi:hypothetical protein